MDGPVINRYSKGVRVAMNTVAIADNVVAGIDESKYLIGALYAETAELPINEVADLLDGDIRDVQGDELIHPAAGFVVTTVEDGTDGIIHVTISGLYDVGDGKNPSATPWDCTRETIATVFGLASHYNRVERARPDRARFLLQVDAITPAGDRYCVFIATMQL